MNYDVEVFNKMVNYFKMNDWNDNINETKRFLFDCLSDVCKNEVQKYNYSCMSMLSSDKKNSFNVSSNNNVLYFIFNDSMSRDDIHFFTSSPIKDSNNGLISYSFYKSLTYLSNYDVESACMLILYYIYHELRHFEQFYDAINDIESTIGLNYAKEKACVDTIKMHDYSLIEKDAEVFAAERTKKLINNGTMIFSPVKFSINDMQYEDYLDILFYSLPTDKKQKFLKKYPILCNEYDENGNRKDFNELLYYKNEYIDSREYDETEAILITDQKLEMYYEILYRSLMETDATSVIDINAAITCLNYIDGYFLSKKNRDLWNCDRTLHIDENKEQELKDRIAYYNNIFDNIFNKTTDLFIYGESKKTIK